MKKNNSESIMGKYSSAKNSSKKKTESAQLMTTYEQRYKGSLSKDVTEPVKTQTITEKIEAKKQKSSPVSPTNVPMRVSVNIAGTSYLLGCTDELSENRIKRVAAIANSILEETRDTNHGLTNSKISILALLDACDQIASLKDENSNLKTEVMYLKQQEAIAKSSIPVELTPMEKLAEEIGNEDN